MKTETLRLLLRSTATLLVAGLAALTVRVATAPTGASELPAPVAPRAPADWVPPAWFPAGTFVDALPGLDRPGPTGGPRIRTPSALLYDIDEGRVIFEKHADDYRPVASLTKLVSALALVAGDYDLDRTVCIGPMQYPTRSGARSKLSTGDCLQGWDLVSAALVASDNRGAYAMAALAGLDPDPFIARMNRVSRELGMRDSHWTDPSGLEDENLSTARDVARAVLAVAAHPLLSTLATSASWDLHYDHRPVRRVFSTNRLLPRRDLLFEAAKTGYTDTAHYCYAATLYTRSGRHLALALLGAPTRSARWRDADRLIRWADATYARDAAPTASTSLAGEGAARPDRAG